MESRREYEQRFEMLLKVWGSRLDAWVQEHKALPAERQRNGQPVVERALQRLDSSKRMLSLLTHVDDDAWEELRKRADTTWYWLRHSIDDVKSVIELARDEPAQAYTPRTSLRPIRGSSYAWHEPFGRRPLAS